MPSSEIRAIALKSLAVDPDVQRSLDTRRVDKMAADFDVNALGLVTVSHRGRDVYFVVDGQHRVAAARAVKGDDWKMTCRVFDGLKLEDEAALFRLLNNTAKVGALDLFRVRVIEGEQVAVYVDEMLHRHGFKVGPNAFMAVAAAERVWHKNAMALERTLGVIVRAWGRDGAATDGRVVEGIGLVFARYGDSIDADSLGERLARNSDAASLIGRAHTYRDIIKRSVVQCIAEIVVEIYNKQRSTRALPPWRS